MELSPPKKMSTGIRGVRPPRSRGVDTVKVNSVMVRRRSGTPSPASVTPLTAWEIYSWEVRMLLVAKETSTAAATSNLTARTSLLSSPSSFSRFVSLMMWNMSRRSSVSLFSRVVSGKPPAFTGAAMRILFAPSVIAEPPASPDSPSLGAGPSLWESLVAASDDRRRRCGAACRFRVPSSHWY